MGWTDPGATWSHIPTSRAFRIELTCVLAGAFADGGHTYGVGDLNEPDADHDHPPVAVTAEPCLCVIASEGMRLRGVLGQAQRLFGLWSSPA